MSQAAATSRIAWVDNLRTLMIVLVVNMHACVTYSHVGGWYRMEVPEPAMPVKIAFVFWQGHLQAFFMGFLFFLAGVFARRSLERRGATAFLRERGRRLGLPSLLYILLIHPFIVCVLLGQPHVADRPSLAVLYGRYLTSSRVLAGNGPMWFALALLAFSLVFVVVRKLKPASLSPGKGGDSPPGIAALLGVGVSLAVATFLVRLWQPIGTNVLNFQLCYFPQYIAAFAVGVAAGRGGWLERLAQLRLARVAGWLGVVGGPLLLAVVLAVGGPPPEQGPVPYMGGWNARALAFAAWEQVTGLAIALGLLAWFRARWNVSNAATTWLSDRAFAVYMLHAPVLVMLTPLLRPVAVHPFAGAAALTVVGLVASFLVSDILRRLPGLRNVL